MVLKVTWFALRKIQKVSVNSVSTCGLHFWWDLKFSKWDQTTHEYSQTATTTYFWGSVKQQCCKTKKEKTESKRNLIEILFVLH